MELSGQFHDLNPLLLGKVPPVTTDWKVEWAPEQVWML